MNPSLFAERVLWYSPIYVTRIVDGDTIDALWDRGDRCYSAVRVRLLGDSAGEFDAHEMRGKMRPQGKQAKGRMEDLVRSRGRTKKLHGLSLPWFVMRTHKDRPTKVRDGFGRILAELLDPNSGDNLGQILIDEGLAEPHLIQDEKEDGG